jgi:hypothetical protein
MAGDEEKSKLSVVAFGLILTRKGIGEILKLDQAAGSSKSILIAYRET